MYIRTQRRPTDRTLGAWCDFLGPWICSGSPTYGAKPDYYNLLSPEQQKQHDAVAVAKVAPLTTAPSDPGTSLLIPNSSFADIFMNAVTGKPTDAQIAVNTNSCVASIQKMRQVAAANGQPGPPVGAEAQCAQDQQAYIKLIGGTASTQAPKTVWAWLILAGVVGGAYLVSR